MHQREALLERFPQLDELGAVGGRGVVVAHRLAAQCGRELLRELALLGQTALYAFWFFVVSQKVTIMITMMRENEDRPQDHHHHHYRRRRRRRRRSGGFWFVSVRFGNGTNVH